MTKILIPKRTVVQCGVAALFSVLLMSWLQIRPLGILFLALFGVWVYKTCCNLRIVPPIEFENECENWMGRLRELRNDQPTMFCAISSGSLFLLAILGHLLSGSTMVIIGLVLAALMSTKYNFKLVKNDHKDFAWSEKLHHETELDDEFMPDVDDINRFVLERASNLATLSSPIEDIELDDERSEEIPSELLIRDLIPEISSKSSDEDDEELVPIVGKEKLLTSRRPTSSDTINSSKTVSEIMEFKRGHFKRDSSLSTTSSSSEESISKGLQFPDHTTVDASSANALMQLGAIDVPTTSAVSDDKSVNAPSVLKRQTQALLPSLLSDMVQWSMGGGGAAIAKSVSSSSADTQHQRVVTALDSSDESDFEILENEDFK